jgi:hypothetical protein
MKLSAFFKSSRPTPPVTPPAFTPAPWKSIVLIDPYAIAIRSNPAGDPLPLNHTLIAEFPMYEKGVITPRIQEANAQLCIKAPELYRALEEALEFLEETALADFPAAARRRMLSGWRQTLAEARGEQTNAR